MKYRCTECEGQKTDEVNIYADPEFPFDGPIGTKIVPCGHCGGTGAMEQQEIIWMYEHCSFTKAEAARELKERALGVVSDRQIANMLADYEPDEDRRKRERRAAGLSEEVQCGMCGDHGAYGIAGLEESVACSCRAGEKFRGREGYLSLELHPD